MRRHQTAEVGLPSGKEPYGRSNAIADELTAGKVFVLHRRDLARRTALDAFRQGIALAAKIVAEMAADHDIDLLREAATQIATLPEDRP